MIGIFCILTGVILVSVGGIVLKNARDQKTWKGVILTIHPSVLESLSESRVHIVAEYFNNTDQYIPIETIIGKPDGYVVNTATPTSFNLPPRWTFKVMVGRGSGIILVSAHLSGAPKDYIK